ncbi:Putative isochorismatase [Septoria linicola]|uniref:Isochorismatase n=1 Tax=Septoria linicola TaxID=215465 RepID=A0A9Q9AQR5_9PEZI|nr:Putative isochorismatase [Septoria linicola]
MPATTNNENSHHQAVIGDVDNFWLYSSQTGFDLTRPPTPSARPIQPRVIIETTYLPIAIDPAKSALIIVDMQNYFLSPALGRSKGAGHAAVDQLIQHAIPAARKAGIRVVWVNWGLTEQEVKEMPPAIKRAFGFEACVDGQSGEEKFANIEAGGGFGLDKHGLKTQHKGMGSEIGKVVDPDTGEEIEAGRVLMRGSWNCELWPSLAKVYDEGRKLDVKPDVWVHKNRMSGMWGAETELEVFLKKEGIRTLLFTGVNTDQCVGGTLTDSYSKGYDCVLLSDGAATNSPEYAQKCYEYNSANGYGFVTSCEKLAAGVSPAVS